MSRIQRTPFPLPLVWLSHHFAARLGLGPSPETPASPPSRPFPARSHTITLFAIFSTSLIFCTRPSPQRLDDGSPPLFGPDGFLQPGLIYVDFFALPSRFLFFCFVFSPGDPPRLGSSQKAVLENLFKFNYFSKHFRLFLYLFWFINKLLNLKSIDLYDLIPSFNFSIKNGLKRWVLKELFMIGLLF